MPGISTILSCSILPKNKVAESSCMMRHRDYYEVTQFVPNSKTAIVFSGYNGYPLYQYEDTNVLILFEGIIYNKPYIQVDGSLRNIANEYLEKKPYKKRLLELVESADGDFIGLIFFKKDKVLIIFNDRLGRLPSFFFIEKGSFAFSREIKFLLHWISHIEFDRTAMAEFLVYEYNLGEKTLVKRITRFSPASLLEIKSLNGEIQVKKEVLLPLKFDTNNLNLTRKEIIEQCVNFFIESLSDRVCKTVERRLHIVADLSGGHDTRAVFGGLCQLGAVFAPCSDSLITGDESYIAQQLATSFGKALFHSSSGHPVDDFKILRNIVYLTDCTVNGWTAVASYYDCLEREKLFTRSNARFMGFGGEFIRHPYRLKTHYSGLIDMVEDAAYNNCLPPASALAIMKLNKHEFRENLKRELTRFLEQKEEDRVKHLYFEYYNKMVNGGEDRHRMFSWTVQPLWGKKLLTFEITNIPPKMISFSFFIDFLRMLDQRLLDVPIYGSSLRLNSRIGVKIYEAQMYLEQTLANNRYALHLYKSLTRKFHKKSDEIRTVVDEIRLMYKDNFVSKQFDLRAMEEYLLQDPRLIEVYQLLTLMMYVSEVGRRFGEKLLAEVLVPTNL